MSRKGRGHHIWHLALNCTNPHMTRFRTEALRPRAHAIVNRLADLLLMAHPRAVVAGGGDTGQSRPVPARAAPAALVSSIADLRAAVKPASDDTWWSTSDAHHLMYRLLVCAPVSAFDVRHAHPATLPAPAGGRAEPLDRSNSPLPAPTPDTGMPATLAFGRMLDATVLPNSRLRPWANAWTAWSLQQLVSLAGVHRCGASGVTDTTDTYVPCPLCHVRIAPVLGHQSPDLIHGLDPLGADQGVPAAHGTSH